LVAVKAAARIKGGSSRPATKKSSGLSIHLKKIEPKKKSEAKNKIRIIKSIPVIKHPGVLKILHLNGGCQAPISSPVKI
jgi:hypothetical protein